MFNKAPSINVWILYIWQKINKSNSLFDKKYHLQQEFPGQKEDIIILTILVNRMPIGRIICCWMHKLYNELKISIPESDICIYITIIYRTETAFCLSIGLKNQYKTAVGCGKSNHGKNLQYKLLYVSITHFHAWI